MVVIFGGLLAALLPLIGAVAAVGGAFLCLLGFAAVITLDPNTVPVTTLLGLGISIDYALLMVSRFREERGAGRPCPARSSGPRPPPADDRLLGADRPVSLAALMIFDDPTFRAIGAAGVAVVVVALLAALTLVPALLALVGGRIPVRRALAPAEGFFSRLAPAVQRRAWPVAIGVAALLLAAGAPLLSLRLENGGANLLPDSFESVQVQQNLQVRFPGAGTDPVTVLARATPEQLDAYVAGLGAGAGPGGRGGGGAGDPARQLAVRVGGLHAGRTVPGRRGQAAGARAACAPAAVPELGHRGRRRAASTSPRRWPRGCRGRSR